MAEDSGSNTAESQVPLLHRSETSDLRLTYTAEQGPPIASTVTSTVETEDLPTPVDLNEVEPEKSGKERLENSGDEEEEEAIILKPPTKKKSLGPNAAFYSGELQSRPSGDYIDQIHENWYWDFGLLEKHHGFIQWLFPVFESSGMNMQSSALSKAEAALIRQSVEASFRVVRSYKLMLNFYGIRLADMETGEVERQPDHWEGRFLNLRMNSHNFLRINRILASLGHLGFHKYRRPLIEFFQTEVRAPDSIIATCEYSLANFWEMALTPESKRYERKTLETKEDRVDSVFFTHLAGNTPQFANFLRQMGEWEESSSAVRLQAIKKDVANFKKWKAIMNERRSKRLASQK